MKKMLSIFDTWMMALTFSEANEHETARQIMNDGKSGHFPVNSAPDSRKPLPERFRNQRHKA